MDLMTIKENFNRGKMDIKEIKWLIDTVKILQQENGAMAEKHAEKDIAMADFKKHMEQLLDQNKKFRKRIFELRAKTGYRVYEENLALHQQIEWYKEMLKGGNENEQCQTSHSLS